MAVTSFKRRNAFRRGRRWAKPMDQTTNAEAVRQPGIDPRQWISNGIVKPGGEDDEIVVFDEEEGQPMVSVLLEPTKIPVFARVGSTFAGNGEGEWTPFVEGDEVLVAIPEGDERSNCVIIARLNNAIDKFPMESVAGQDPTTNTFAFTRRRTPRVEEFNGPIVFRSSLSGALFSIDTSGVVTIRDGQAAVLQMSPDVIGFQGPSDAETPPDILMQLNISDRQYSLNIGDAIFNMSASDATPAPTNILSVPDNLTISAGGNAASEHLMTVEAFWHGMQQALNSVSLAIAALGVAPLTGVSLAPIFSLLGTTASFPLAIPLAASTPIIPTLSTAIASGFNIMSPKLPAAVPVNPGLGSATILVG